MATTSPDPEGAIFMPTDPNIDALGPEPARQVLKQNVTNYAATALVQSVEISALESLTDLDDQGKAELAVRHVELEKANARRAAFQTALDGLPATTA
jgi:hypothetical protein